MISDTIGSGDLRWRAPSDPLLAEGVQDASKVNHRVRQYDNIWDDIISIKPAEKVVSFPFLPLPSPLFFSPWILKHILYLSPFFEELLSSSDGY